MRSGRQRGHARCARCKDDLSNCNTQLSTRLDCCGASQPGMLSQIQQWELAVVLACATAGKTLPTPACTVPPLHSCVLTHSLVCFLVRSCTFRMRQVAKTNTAAVRQAPGVRGARVCGAHSACYSGERSERRRCSGDAPVIHNQAVALSLGSAWPVEVRRSS